MLRVINVEWTDHGESVNMCIEYESMAGNNKMQVSGICIGCQDDQGYTEEWSFFAGENKFDVIYSHFEPVSFSEQIACEILAELYPNEKDQIIVEPGVA